jgi:predicted membrane-bound spermidine synthase
VFLFGSGLCSLVYETVWLRELRLIFGASSMASGAVIACFVGGLGAGALFFGKRADACPRPIRLYALLEGGAAVSAAITPPLLFAVKAVYLGVGGTRVLGAAGACTVRLLLSALTFLVPTVLIGGTLPTAARAAQDGGDRGRRTLGLLYGMNTLGAVCGCLLSTFVLLERYGDRATLWAACLVNVVVALAAGRVSTRATPRPRAPALRSGSTGRLLPLTVALASAAVSGFVFCLMELVWYRLLTPLLGGTVYSFALILAVALLGLGLGAAAYASRPFTNRPTLQALAWTCMVEGACLAIPYAIGDRLAVLAILLHPLGFGSELLQTSAAVAVTSVVVLAPAAISGAQLPLLIGLLGEGDDGVGRDAGSIFAFNTFGSVLGSLAGAFGLIPALSALGCWHLAVWLLLGAGGVAVALDVSRRRLAAAAPLLAGAVALVGASADGPTAAWRHSPIGAGRVALEDVRNPNAARAWERLRRRSIAWEQDGIESSLAIDYEVGLSFVVNGKIDGSAHIHPHSR